MTNAIGQRLPSEDAPLYICIEGIIGTGKTSLATQLAHTFNKQIMLEQPEINPFLPQFYGGAENIGLATQLQFLLQRVDQLANLPKDSEQRVNTICDFLFEKDALFAQSILNDQELALYQSLHQKVAVSPPKPDLVVYLQADTDTLLDRIAKRGITQEQTIQASYLNKLNDTYTRFFHDYDQVPLLIINTRDIDWVNHPHHYQHLVEYLLTIKNGRHYYNPKLELRSQNA